MKKKAKASKVIWKIEIPSDLEDELIEALCNRGDYHLIPDGKEKPSPKKFAQKMINDYAMNILIGRRHEIEQHAQHQKQVQRAKSVAAAFEG